MKIQSLKGRASPIEYELLTSLNNGIKEDSRKIRLLNTLIAANGITKSGKSTAESIELDRAMRRKLAAEKQFYEILTKIEKRILKYGA